ncbi:LOW QUALITY PROTEIN: putative G-protein coupled receptor 142, partial [Galemys pyrenaicus]
GPVFAPPPLTGFLLDPPGSCQAFISQRPSSPPGTAWPLGGPDEGVVDWLDDEVEVEGVLHQVLRVAPLQVSVRQEVACLLAALVETIGVADQQAAVLTSPYQHRLLEAHASSVATAAGRRDHKARSAVLWASCRQGSAGGICVDRPQADRQPARREEHVPGDPAAGVVAARAQLCLEAGAAIVTGWVVDYPGGAPGGCEVVAGQEGTAVDVEELGVVQRGGGVELVGLKQEVGHCLPVARQGSRARLQLKKLCRRDHRVADGTQSPLCHRGGWPHPAQPRLQRMEQLQLILQHQVRARQELSQQLRAHRAPLGARCNSRQVPGQEPQAALSKGLIPGAHRVVVPAHRRASTSRQVSAHIVSHAPLQGDHTVFGGQPVQGDGLAQQHPPPRSGCSAAAGTAHCVAQAAGDGRGRLGPHRCLLPAPNHVASIALTQQLLQVLEQHLCPLTCTSGQAHQGQDGPEAAPGPRPGSHTRGWHQPPFLSSHPPPTQPLPWIGGKWPQLSPRQPLEPESGSPRGYCAAAEPLLGRFRFLKGRQGAPGPLAVTGPEGPSPSPNPKATLSLAQSTLGSSLLECHVSQLQRKDLEEEREGAVQASTTPPPPFWGGLALQRGRQGQGTGGGWSAQSRVDTDLGVRTGLLGCRDQKAYPAALSPAARPGETLLPTPNGSPPGQEFEGYWPEIPEKSPCVAGVAPVIYYSILLGLGLPVNLLSAVALGRLAARTRKPSYYYLLALTASDIITQVVIVFMGFLLQGAVLARQVPQAVVRTANILQFAANHASVWIAVLLTVDRYRALCRPLHHRAASSPGCARRAIAAVLAAALLTGIPFYWWLDLWRDEVPASTLDEVLKWAHCLTVYFIPCGIFLTANSAIICQLRRRSQGALRPWVGKSTAILLGVTTLFTLLWAPRIFVMLYHLYVEPVYRDWRVHLALDVANMAAMLNTTVNFGLYCLVSKTFRATVRDVVHEVHLPCTLGSRPEESALKFPGLPKGAE